MEVFLLNNCWNNCADLISIHFSLLPRSTPTPPLSTADFLNFCFPSNNLHCAPVRCLPESQTPSSLPGSRQLPPASPHKPDLRPFLGPACLTPGRGRHARTHRACRCPPACLSAKAQRLSLRQQDGPRGAVPHRPNCPPARSAFQAALDSRRPAPVSKNGN